jgi:hypothetical protein
LTLSSRDFFLFSNIGRRRRGSQLATGFYPVGHKVEEGDP